MTPAPEEEWRPIPGYEGLYEVSDQGRVRSLERQLRHGHHWGSRLLSTDRTPGARYPQVQLRRNGSGRRFMVHQLVLEAFDGPCPPGLEARHLDGDSGHSVRSNLRWGTRAENAEDRRRHGTLLQGETHPGAKLSAKDVIAIRKRIAGGEPPAVVARDYDVTAGTVAHIQRRRTWRGLQDNTTTEEKRA